MRWLASRPRWLLLGVFVVLVLCVVLGYLLRNAVLSSAMLLVFFVFFATLMAFVGRREKSSPSQPALIHPADGRPATVSPRVTTCVVSRV